MTREAVYQGQNLDHPRVNPNFYSRPTRYVYFNAAKPMEHSGDSGPPQVCFNALETQIILQVCWCLSQLRPSMHCRHRQGFLISRPDVS